MTKKYGDYSDFDVESFLEEHEIFYRTGGKNIGRGFIGLACIYCGGIGEHLGVRINEKSFTCFQCGEKGTALRLVYDLLKCSEWREAHQYMKPFRDPTYQPPELYVPKPSKLVHFSSKVTDLLPTGIKFLRDKGYDPDTLVTRYGLQQTSMWSKLKSIEDGEEIVRDYKHRIIVPIVMDRKVVSWTGRDITDKQDPRWKHCPIVDCIKPAASCLYNVDTVMDRALFIEGPSDVWRMGDETIGMMGVQFTKEQIQDIAELDLKKAVIMFDAKAEKEAKKLATALNSIIPEVYIQNMIEGDPGELDDTSAFMVKQQLLYG